MKSLLLTLPFIIICYSCGGTNSGESAEQTMETILPDKKAEVAISELRPSDFNHELISNGRVSACNAASLRFQSSELISHIYVKNGDRVKKGQPIAELEKFKFEMKCKQAADELERAKLDLQDVLIGQGYSLEDSDKIPETIMKLAKVKSSYDRARSNHELAVYELENMVLKAPFDGVVANLFNKPHNPASTSEVFCTVIDNTRPEVNFTILESELSIVKPGDRVQVTPFSGKGVHAEGEIIEINPLVDTNGMVKVKARVAGNGKLYEGMNVRVTIRRSLGEELVIPKSAVVLRSGKQVVFTCRDGKAIWNYVKTGLENIDSYTVVEGLQAGDTVIVGNNVNLAHETSVIY